MKPKPRRQSDPQLPLLEPTPQTPRLFSVAELTGVIRDLLAKGLPSTLHVVGQISNYKLHASGHAYFTLKDETSEIVSVMWRTAVQTLKFKPLDGMEVVLTAAIDVYERSGRYQLYVRKIEPRGVGALELAFRQLQAKLQLEGLFDSAHKKPLPAYPQRIAVVTSPSGAALRDILTTLRRRFALAELLLVPVSVQGEGAAAELTQAVRKLNDWADLIGGVDVIIIGRGGGSIEDLWAFNDEMLARSIFASRIAVISAVGHETDVTICDLVADVRAATPTAAAELAVPEGTAILQALEGLAQRINRRLSHVLSLCGARLTGLAQRSWFADPVMMIFKRSQRVEDAAQALVARWSARHRTMFDLLNRFERHLQTLEPAALTGRKRAQLTDAWHRIGRGMERGFVVHERRLASAVHRLDRLNLADRLLRRDEKLSALEKQLAMVTDHQAQNRRAGLESLYARLEALSYRGTLRRGFSITRIAKSGMLMRTRADVRPGDIVVTETAEDRIESRILDAAGRDVEAADSSPTAGT